MSETLIYIILFALLMFFMHRGHGGMGCHGGHSHHSHGDKKPDESYKNHEVNTQNHHHI